MGVVLLALSGPLEIQHERETNNSKIENNDCWLTANNVPDGNSTMIGLATNE